MIRTGLEGYVSACAAVNVIATTKAKNVLPTQDRTFLFIAGSGWRL